MKLVRILFVLALLLAEFAVLDASKADASSTQATMLQRGMSEAAGAITFSVFCVTMGVVRLVGEQLERRFGAVRILVVGSLIGGFGLLLTAIVPTVWLAYVGFALAGGGLAFAFPVALDLAGVIGRRGDGTGGEREIGFVTTIAYSGFLIGPPMIGGVAQITNLEFAVGFAGVVAMLIAPAAIASAAARKREDQQTTHELHPVA